MMETVERKAVITRKTGETDITLKLTLQGIEKSRIVSGVPFFDHMLDAMSRHGRFFLDLECRGDHAVDDHHSVEDIGICLGKAFKRALGEKAGITRFGEASVPMDDALTQCVVDLSGRSFFQYSGAELSGYINRYHEELTLEFLRAFADNGEMNLHIRQLYGENRHHIHESIFKALGIALFRAWRIDETLGGAVPSTKGTIA